MKGRLTWTILVALLCGIVSLFPLSTKSLAANSERWETAGEALLDSGSRDIGEAIAIAVVIVLAFAAPSLGKNSFGKLERAFARLAAHRKQAIFGAAVFSVAVRLALLPVIPIPQASVPDEFGYLLLADTFASGRITNPTHPMWRYFETLYVFHQPTYTSVYPIAQGLIMAVPAALGSHPWFGVCLSIGLMCAALCWMLQAWLPPKWALLGALLAGARLSIATYWMNSYWGGATGAIGGALLLGALPRLLRQARVRDALWAGLGAVVLSQSRPFEGALLSLPVSVLLLYRFVGGTNRSVRVLMALVGVSLVIVAGNCYYNWRVTGDPWLLPYQLYQRNYGMPQNLRWSAPVLTNPRAALNQDLLDNFKWQLGRFQAESTWKGLAAALPGKLETFWDFYLQPLSALPLVLLPLTLRRKGIRFLLFTGAFVLLAGFVLYPFFFPHYAAPLCGLLLVLILQGVRYLRAMRWRRVRLGAALFRWYMVAVVASCFLVVLGGTLAPQMLSQGDTPRSRIEEDLKRRDGKHLVLVRYTEAHNFHDPWIYNSADIDKSRVIWARQLDEASVKQLLHRYPEREAWLVNADEDDPELVPYGKDHP